MTTVPSKATDAAPAIIGVSALRRNLLRVVYAGTFLFVGTNAWRAILTHQGPWDPLAGVAYSFWAAYATLLLLGLRHPLKLLPLVLLQLFYKLVWLVIVARPLWSSGQLGGSARMTAIFVAAVVVDLAVTPWSYVARNLLRDGGRTLE